MRRSAGACNNHANSTVGGFASVLSGAVRRAMRGSYVDLISNSETIKRFAGLLHYFEIRITSHYY
jgi:hypothetical protein